MATNQAEEEDVVQVVPASRSRCTAPSGSTACGRTVRWRSLSRRRLSCTSEVAVDVVLGAWR